MPDDHLTPAARSGFEDLNPFVDRLNQQSIVARAQSDEEKDDAVESVALAVFETLTPEQRAQALSGAYHLHCFASQPPNYCNSADEFVQMEDARRKTMLYQGLLRAVPITIVLLVLMYLGAVVASGGQVDSSVINAISAPFTRLFELWAPGSAATQELP